MPRKRPDHPLTTEHYDALCRLGGECSRTMEYLDRCAKCEIDVTPEREETEAQLRMIDAIRSQFFPDRK